MNMQDIRERAKGVGVKPARMTKVQLVKAIQFSEGNFDCFASALDSECDQLNCIWRDDCFAAAKKLDS